jgi:hypothetical protein
MYVIVTGNMADWSGGVVIVGPFPSEFEADEYLHALNGDGTVMEVQSP